MRKQRVEKKDINELYRMQEFKNAIQYANQNCNIAGVDTYLEELQKKYQDYKKEMDELVMQEKPLLDNKFQRWNTIEKVKNISKWITVISFILSILGMFSNAGTFFAIIIILIMLMMFFGIAATIILKIICVVLRAQYNDFFKSVGDNATIINRKYMNDIPALWNAIDNLYLNSLEQTHRETVLMRRDQERYHQEHMRVEQERLQSQKRMEEEQRRARMVSETVLEIEREREERYWKNRY